MTEPTQAQIKAAAKAIAENAHHQGLKWGEVEPINISKLAQAALTAAGVVGEQWKPDIHSTKLTIWNTAVAITIERCAQVVRDRATQYDHQNNNQENALWNECMEIIAAIRALKENLT